MHIVEEKQTRNLYSTQVWIFLEIIISNHSIDIQCVEDLDRDIIIIIIALIVKFFFFCVNYNNINKYKRKDDECSGK